MGLFSRRRKGGFIELPTDGDPGQLAGLFQQLDALPPAEPPKIVVNVMVMPPVDWVRSEVVRVPSEGAE